MLRNPQRKIIFLVIIIISKKDGFKRAISRILSILINQERGSFILAALPGTMIERAAPRFPIWPCTRWGLPCLADYSLSGGLLPHLFTLTKPKQGGLFSAALAVSMILQAYRPRVLLFKNNITRHRALRSSDFPPPAHDRKRSPALLKPRRTYRPNGDETSSFVKKGGASNRVKQERHVPDDGVLYIHFP